jgi:hypothetical protein
VGRDYERNVLHDGDDWPKLLNDPKEVKQMNIPFVVKGTLPEP